MVIGRVVVGVVGGKKVFMTKLKTASSNLDYVNLQDFRVIGAWYWGIQPCAH